MRERAAALSSKDIRDSETMNRNWSVHRICLIFRKWIIVGDSNRIINVHVNSRQESKLLDLLFNLYKKIHVHLAREA